MPQNIKELQQFLGFINFYRQFIPNCAELMKPLVNLLSKNVPFTWGQQHQQASDSLTKLLVQLPKLYTPNPNQRFNIFSDASDFALGAVLEQNGHPILYASRVLNASERRYSTYDKELLAIYFALKQFRPYIWGAKTVVLHTDRHSLSHLFKQKDLSSRQARYLDFFADFDFEIKYIRGAQNYADALSRISQGPALCYVTVVSPVIWADIKAKIQDLGKTDEEYQQLLKSQHNPTQYCVADHLLYYQSDSTQPLVMVVPNNPELRTQIIKHDSLYAGHKGQTATIAF